MFYMDCWIRNHIDNGTRMVRFVPTIGHSLFSVEHLTDDPKVKVTLSNNSGLIIREGNIIDLEIKSTENVYRT